MFHTTVTTLTAIKNTYFHIMFSGNYGLKPMEGTTNTYFIDRDGKHFRLILNLLRDGKLVLPEKESHRIEVMIEIDFYCLNDYLNSITEREKLTKQIESERLDFEHISQINKWANLPIGTQWKIIYKATVDGFEGVKFHEKCDGKGPTITIIKSKKGNQFGGYASASWHSSGGYIQDPNSFIYLLKGEKLNLMKFPCKRSNFSLYSNKTHGITFGGGYDLFICNNSNICSDSYTNMNNQYYKNTTANPFILDGSKHFLVDEILVFAQSN
eukprot:gene8091-9957_t